MSRRIWAVLALSAAFSAVPVSAQSTVAQLWEQKVHQKIKTLDDGLNGVLGVAFIDLTSGHVFSYNGDTSFPTASSIKIPILIQMFRDEEAGRFHFSDKVTLGAKDNAGGSVGPLQDALNKGPVTLTVAELVQYMIEYSDNSATNKCIEMAGMDRINQLIEGFGLQHTHLRRKMMDVAAAAHGNENIGSPLDLSRLLQLIYEGKAADADSCKRMIALLKKPVDAYMRSFIPENIELASKPGDLDGAKCEAGIVFLPKRPFIVTVMSTYLDLYVNPVGPAAKIVFDYFDKIAHSDEWGRRLD